LNGAIIVGEFILNTFFRTRSWISWCSHHSYFPIW